jgi:hypothetical protein
MHLKQNDRPQILSPMYTLFQPAYPVSIFPTSQAPPFSNARFNIHRPIHLFPATCHKLQNTRTDIKIKLHHIFLCKYHIMRKINHKKRALKRSEFEKIRPKTF